MPKRSYLAARPHAEVLEPREVVNPGEYRHPPIPEWTLDYDRTLNSYTPVPVDQALTPQDAHHEVCGSPLNPAPGWDWKFDNETRLYRAIELRPKTRIPEWTLRFDPKCVLGTPVPVGLDTNQAHHPEYGSPLDPAPGWTWQFNSVTHRLLPSISDEPDRFSTPQRRLYRWHPDQGHFSLVREDDDDGEDYDLYEYDTDFGRRGFFKPYQPPHRPTKPRHLKIEPEPETPPHQGFFVRLPDGTYAVTREYSRDDLYVYDAKKKRYVRVA